MTLYEYNSLEETQQWQELWDNGLHLTSIKYLDAKFSLYSLFMFFVEVELYLETDKIKGKKTFKHGDIMQKYIGKIDF